MPIALRSKTPNPLTLPVQVGLDPLPPLQRLAEIWQDLETRADRSFFLSWTWIGTWLKTIPCRPRLLVARLEGQVVGLGLVHAVLRTRHRVMPVRTLLLNQTGDPAQDVITIEYNDFLIDRAHRDAVRRACLRFLAEHREIDGHEIGELALGGIESGCRAEIEALGRPVQERASAGSAFVDLARLRRRDQTFLDSLTGSTARRIRRSLALYRERGEVEVKPASSVDEALEFFECAGRLHQERWTARGQPGAFAFPYYVMFHRRLIRAGLPDGKVELMRVSAGREPIGFLYNFLDRGRVSYYFSGFRFEDDNRLKPGLVCHALCIERHLEAGMDVYDFMGGDQRYKLELGRPGPRILTLAVQLPNWMLAAERPLRRLKQAIVGTRAG